MPPCVLNRAASRKSAGISLENRAPGVTHRAEARCYYSAPMGKTREIKKRIKAVGNIRRITNTMRMIATSKFARAQQKATATKPYTEGVFQLVREIAGNLSGGGFSHPLINGPANAPKTAPRPLTLIITSD